ncbi:hypothetical protein CAPTEDRAFT_215941 [Capitella teleta]|uniref:Uncharacterized protein n=1 Tax=Capitella teleta TaxID=283909 RepID=R7VBM1_CAPTE|nr:hypothetical protein CAPTEDRAFT_215941 [Capitella teleta]|eukprot:ELU16213.1 hypothetical protein CAPTEDRAFT_215941 [Capitella teleta]
MLSRIAAIEPSTPTPVVVPADIPDVWVTDRIDLHDLARSQKEQFCDAYVEASQETDESPYIVQGSLIFTMAEPSRNAGRYLRLLLPQQFRQQVIDRCHAEEEGERLQAIRLAERILREYRSKQKETYRENEPSRAKRLPPGTFVSVRILNPKKGETRWQPGYQVISSHDGALRVIELDTGNVVRINQRNVREIPESKPYDEIKPIPPLKNQTTFDYVSSEAKPIPIVEESYLPTRIPRGPKRPIPCFQFACRFFDATSSDLHPLLKQLPVERVNNSRPGVGSWINFVGASHSYTCNCSNLAVNIEYIEDYHADDTVLIASSEADLQHLLDIVDRESEDVGLGLNT